MFLGGRVIFNIRVYDIFVVSNLYIQATRHYRIVFATLQFSFFNQGREKNKQNDTYK